MGLNEFLLLISLIFMYIICALIEKIIILKDIIEKTEDYNTGLWATDRPDKITEESKNKYFWKLQCTKRAQFASRKRKRDSEPLSINAGGPPIMSVCYTFLAWIIDGCKF